MQKRNSPIAKILLIFAALIPLLLMVNFTFAQKVSRKILSIPYFTQENGPDCWAASTLMIANSVSPKTNNNIEILISSVGEFDGIPVREMEGNAKFKSKISNLTGVSPEIETYWSGTNLQSTIADNIKTKIDNDQPVMICSTQPINDTKGGHCVVIVGYNGDSHFYIHDPRGLAGMIRKAVPHSKVFSSNASYALISLPKPLAADRNLLTAKVASDAFSFIMPKLASGSSSRTSNIQFKLDPTQPNGYKLAGDLSKAGNIPSEYNILSFGKGTAILIANSADSNKTVKATFTIKRKDGSKKLKSFEIYKSVLPYDIKTFERKFSDQFSLVELRDEKKAVPCELLITFFDADSGIKFHEEKIDFTLEPFTNDVKLSVDKKDKNKLAFTVSSDKLPANAKYYYKFKKVHKDISKESNTTLNPYEYNFNEPGEYYIKVDVKYLSRGKNKQGKSETKEIPFGSAETFVDIDQFAKITQSQNNDEYTFKLDSDITFVNADWFIKEQGKNNFRKLPQSGTQIKEIISKQGDYVIKAVMLNNLGDEIGSVVSDVTVNSQNQEDLIEQAYQKQDWQNLYKIYTTTKVADDKKLAGKHLGTIASDFNNKYSELISKLEETKKKDNEEYKKAYDICLKSFDEDANCVKEMKDQHDDLQKQLEESINELEYASGFYDKYYVQLNPSNDINKANPQKEIFEISSKLKDYNKLSSEKSDYTSICMDQNSGSGKLFIKLKPTKTSAISNEQVDLYAQFYQTPGICNEDIKLKWSNNAVGTDYNEAYFVATAEGRYSPTVTAYCGGKVVGSASVGIAVKGGVTGNITGLAEDQVYFGTTKDLELKTDLIKAADVIDNSCDGNSNNPFCVDTVSPDKAVRIAESSKGEASVYIPSPDDEELDEEPEKSGYVVRWDSNRDVKFEPAETEGSENTPYKTEVTFNRMENPVKIWANILQWKDGSLETVGEANVAEIEVVSPFFKIEFSPTQDKAKIGDEVKASVTSNPPVDPKLIDFRWVEPVDRKEVNNGEIVFTPKDGKTVKFRVIARVPHFGDIINDRIKADYTTGEHIVKAELIGPKFDKASQEWSEKEKGLVDKHKPLVTGQAILAVASVEGYSDDVNYHWSANDECSVDAGHYSEEITVSRNEAGTCSLSVIAYDKAKRKLGHGSLEFDVIEQDSDSLADSDKKSGQDDKGKDELSKQEEQKKQNEEKASDLIKQAKEKVEAGDFASAEKLAEEANKLDPSNAGIQDFITSIAIEKKKQNQNKVSELVEKAKRKSSSGDYDGAEKLLEEAAKIAPEDKLAKDMIASVKEKKLKAKSAKELVDKAKQSITSGNLKIGVAELEKATLLDPANKEAKELLETTKQKMQQRLAAEQTIKNATLKAARGNLDEAEVMLQELLKADPDNKFAAEQLGYVQYKKNYIDNQFSKVKDYVSKGYFNQAMAELGVCQNMSPGYPLNDEIEEYIIKAMNDLINSKYSRAKSLVAEGKLDEAVELLKTAISIDPNNRTVVLYSNSIIADIDKINKFRESLHTALFKYKNYSAAETYMNDINALNHPLYPPVVQAKEWYESAIADDPDNPDNLIAKADVAIENKNIEEAESLITRLLMNTQLSYTQKEKVVGLQEGLEKRKDQQEISNKLIEAMKAGDYNEAKRLINHIKANQDYYEPKMEKVLSFEKEVDAKIALIDKVNKAKAEFNICEQHFKAGNYEQALASCNKSYQIYPIESINKLTAVIQNKIEENKRIAQQEKQQQQMANVTKIAVVNVQDTILKVPYPEDWDTNKTLEGDFDFTNDSVMRGLTIMNRVIPYHGQGHQNLLIDQHINHMLSGSGYISKSRGSRVIQGIKVSYANLVFNEDGRTIYQSIYYPYNGSQIFEILSSAGNPAVGKQERDKVLNSIVAAILKSKSPVIATKPPVQQTPTPSSNVVRWIKRFEYGVNRPGAHYSAKVPPRAEPEICAKACEADNRCRSFTYTEPGITSQSAVCYYRDSVPKSIAASGYTSGVVSFMDTSKLKSSKSSSIKTSNSTDKSSYSGPPRVIFINKTNIPVHFYGNRESCLPTNKVMPGSNHSRGLMINQGFDQNGEKPFFVGRNGQTIAKINIPKAYINQNGQKVYLIYDSSGLHMQR